MTLFLLGKGGGNPAGPDDVGSGLGGGEGGHWEEEGSPGDFSGLLLGPRNRLACHHDMLKVLLIFCSLHLSLELSKLTDGGFEASSGFLAVVPRKLRFQLVHNAVLLLDHQLQRVHLTFSCIQI